MNKLYFVRNFKNITFFLCSSLQHLYRSPGTSWCFCAVIDKSLRMHAAADKVQDHVRVTAETAVFAVDLWR